MNESLRSAFILFLLCWLFSLTAAPTYADPAQAVALTPAEQDWLAANPAIRLGSDAHWRPYVWLKTDGTQAGIETDLIARINALTGANIQLVLSDWSDLVDQARRGALHGLAVSTSQPERADRFLFSQSPYSAHKYVFTRPDSRFARMEDLAGLRVGVLRNNLAERKLLDAWPDIQPVELDTPLALAVALHNGELDAVISSANLLWTVDENLLPRPRLAFTVPGSRIDLRYSILKEHAPLLGIIDKALAAIDPVEMMAMLRKWEAQPRPSIALSAAERAWLAQKHPVRVRIGEAPPWEINRPAPAGMAVDYLRIIGELFAIDFRFIAADDAWIDGFEDMAGAHRHYDLLPAAKRTEERLASLAMSQDYLSSPWAIFTRQDSRDIFGLDDLRGRTVAVERGYVMHALLEAEAPAISLSVQESTRDALLAVSTGRADAYVGNLLVTDYLMQAHGIGNLKMAGPTPFGEHQQAMVNRQEWAPLIALIDKGLNAIPAEQHFAIRQHWLRSVAEGGLQGPLVLTPAERAALDATVIRRARASAWMPFDFADRDGAPTGVAEDYWALIRDKLGVQEETSARQPFAAILAAMERGDIDLYPATTRTADREGYALFSDPYEHFPIAIAGPASAGLFVGTASLAGRRVAVGRNYSAYHLLKDQSPDIDFVPVADTRAALAAVASGRADVAVDILPVLHQQIEQFPPRQVKLLGITDVDFPLQLMLSDHQAALLPLLNRAIAAITPAERAAIHNKWLLRQVVTAPDYSLLWQVLAVAGLILAIILFWNQRLRREVARRQQAEAGLRQAKEEADRANRAKGDFLANMSHEIRNPLNAVIGLTRLSLDSASHPKLRDYLGKIDLSARTLLALISDILDLSRLEADKLPPRQEPFALGEVLERVRVMTEQQAADKGLALTIADPPQGIGPLIGDGLRLTQVLLNLAGNAIKFTEQGQVRPNSPSRARSGSPCGNCPPTRALALEFAVTDTGIGIPAARQADLFEAFTQVDTSPSRRHGGSGLGLTISARLVALMGGRLQVASTEGEGSCFWFSLTLPKTTPEPAKTSSLTTTFSHQGGHAGLRRPNAPHPPSLHGARILVAEDDPVNQLLIQELLRQHGASVTLTANGTEAVAAATRETFDLILMDIRMPGMDGLEATRRIHTQTATATPIIALTANALASEREHCLAAGMDGYLTKPLEPETLLAALGAMVKGGEWPVVGDDQESPIIKHRPPVTVTASDMPGRLPGFDAAKVRRWQAQSPDVWRAMTSTFLDDYPAAANAITTALDAGDRAGARETLHRLRGAAGALGAEALTTTAAELEQALATDQPIDAGLVGRFFANAHTALAVLRDLGEPGPASTTECEPDRTDGAQCRQRFSELEALLEVGNTRALKHLPWLKSCADAARPGVINDSYRDLITQIEGLDFPAALESLRGLEIANPSDRDGSHHPSR